MKCSCQSSPHLNEQSQQCIIIYCIISGPRKVNWKQNKLRYNDRPLAFIILWQRGFPNYLLKLPGFLLKSSIFPARLVLYYSSAEFGSLSHIFRFHCYSNLVNLLSQPYSLQLQLQIYFLNWLHFSYVWPVGKDLYFFERYPSQRPASQLKTTPPIHPNYLNLRRAADTGVQPRTQCFYLLLFCFIYCYWSFQFVTLMSIFFITVLLCKLQKAMYLFMLTPRWT